MVIVETRPFTRRVTQLMSDDEYSVLQHALISRPDAGVVIPHGGGIRKMRWGLAGRGKRGGARIIYYWAVSKDQILMLFVFAKNEADDLTADQLDQLREAVLEEYP